MKVRRPLFNYKGPIINNGPLREAELKGKNDVFISQALLGLGSPVVTAFISNRLYPTRHQWSRRSWRCTHRRTAIIRATAGFIEKNRWLECGEAA